MQRGLREKERTNKVRDKGERVHEFVRDKGERVHEFCEGSWRKSARMFEG